MARKQEKAVFINKQVGETPLEALERWRATRRDLVGVPMTYAGRLDPMAEGTLLVLIGDECKNKSHYLGLDKEYEVDVVFGVATDTYDALGLVVLGEVSKHSDKVTKNWSLFDPTFVQRYVGKFTQEYPAYSSKTFKGKQLHELARAGELPDVDEMPTKEVEIYSIEIVGTPLTCSAGELKKVILDKIAQVKGDFRQAEICARWTEVLSDPLLQFNVLKIRVKCSSGTYMRSLADRMGKDARINALALGIKRTKIFL